VGIVPRSTELFEGRYRLLADYELQEFRGSPAE
jgi:hypothetical protein